MIVAIGLDGSIGRKGNLIWKIPEDLKHFKAITTGHPVIMGRKTWESLPKRPLPNRRNIVLTRRQDYDAPGAETVYSVKDALEATKDLEPFIIGGEEIYKAFMPFVNEIFLTRIETSCDDADAFLELDLKDSWEKVEESESFRAPEGVTYRYERYIRKE